jgi:hypothetical protein
MYCCFVADAIEIIDDDKDIVYQITNDDGKEVILVDSDIGKWLYMKQTWCGCDLTKMSFVFFAENEVEMVDVMVDGK